MSLFRPAFLALSLVSSFQLTACGPQPIAVNTQSTGVSHRALQGAGLVPDQTIAFQELSGFRLQQEASRVLMVIANQDFWYADYALPRQALEANGVQVTVAAASTEMAYPHAGSGEGADQGQVQPDISLLEANADDYDAILFVGGWGASAYQYAVSDSYFNAHYNGSPALRSKTNALINAFLAQDKYVTALCHGVTILAWARVNGVSPLTGHEVTGWNGAAPGSHRLPHQARGHIESNGAQMLASGAVGLPHTSADDVIVSGQIITAEDYRSGYLLGEVLAQRLAASAPVPTPVPTAQPSTAAPQKETPLPILLVIANQDFYYREYAEPRAAFESAGIAVVVTAEQVQPSFPHPNTGESGSGEVMPDLRLDQVNAQDYSAVVFVGGWGSSQYQYAFEGTYQNPYYNGNSATKNTVNQLINSFAAQDKYVMGICHAASILAWARINGESPLAGRLATGGPWLPAVNGAGPVSTRQYIEANGGTYVPSRSVGDPGTAADDLVIAGRFITAEDYDTAAYAGATLAQMLLAD